MPYGNQIITLLIEELGSPGLRCSITCDSSHRPCGLCHPSETIWYISKSAGINRTKVQSKLLRLSHSNLPKLQPGPHGGIPARIMPASSQIISPGKTRQARQSGNNGSLHNGTGRTNKGQHGWTGPLRQTPAPLA